MFNQKKMDRIIDDLNNVGQTGCKRIGIWHRKSKENF